MNSLFDSDDDEDSSRRMSSLFDSDDDEDSSRRGPRRGQRKRTSTNTFDPTPRTVKSYDVKKQRQTRIDDGSDHDYSDYQGFESDESGTSTLKPSLGPNTGGE